MNIAILGAGHWHVPLYEVALSAAQARIAAVSAQEPEPRERLGALFGCPTFATDAELLKAIRIDFAFVFGTHRSMFEAAKRLVERGIPFSIEKPVAFETSERRKLAELVGATSLFVSVPMVYRVTPLSMLMGRFIAEHGALAHLSVRCFAGPPSRYLENGSPWMLDPDMSGGGCTRNLAPHYVDLFTSGTNEPVTGVTAVMNNLAYGSAVEDYSCLHLRSRGGAVATIETGYNFPVHHGGIRDFSLVASTTSAFIRASETKVEILDRQRDLVETTSWDIDSNAAFGPYVVEVLRRFRAGEPPVIGLEEFNPVMDVIDAGYASQELGTTVALGT